MSDEDIRLASVKERAELTQEMIEELVDDLLDAETNEDFFALAGKFAEDRNLAQAIIVVLASRLLED